MASGQEREVLAFNIENLINGVHGEPMLCDLSISASDEEKEMFAWHRIAQSFGMIPQSSAYTCSYACRLLFIDYRHTERRLLDSSSK